METWWWWWLGSLPAFTTQPLWLLVSWTEKICLFLGSHLEQVTSKADTEELKFCHLAEFKFANHC